MTSLPSHYMRNNNEATDGSGWGTFDFGLVAGYGVPGGIGEFSCMVGDSHGAGACGADTGADAVTDPLLIEVAKL